MMLAIVGMGCAAAETASDLSAVYAAYAEVLREKETLIRQYWQGGGDWTDDGYMPVTEPRAIALADIMGGDAPELIFIARRGSAYEGYTDATLYIYTCENGAAKQLIGHEMWDVYGGSSGITCLYQIAGAKDLCGVVEGNENGFYHWFSNDGATLQEESLIRMYDGDDPYSLLNGQQVDNALYDANIDSFPRTAETLLIYSVYRDPYDGNTDWNGRNLIQANGLDATAMTYDEAMALLGGAISSEDIEEVPADEVSVPSQTGDIALPAEALELRLTCFFTARDSQSILFHADGSFEFGSGGITGIGNGGWGSYTGRLDWVEQISDHVYALHIASTQIMGTETYGDYDSWDEQPFFEGDTLSLVLPGADESELNGSIVTTLAQLELYGTEMGYESEYFYIGTPDQSGTIQYYPYETSQY